MYSNILVISDNLFLCQEFEKVVDRLSLSDLKWNFAISPFSDIEAFKKVLRNNVKVLNLKNNDTIEWVTSNFDLVFSIHCKQFFPSNLVDKVKCINVHPGYNPINRGWYPQVFAIIYDLPIGATIHEIDNKLDHGKIIDRELVEKSITDTSETLYDKIVAKEIELLEKNLSIIIKGTYTVAEPENEGNIFLKKNFSNLCELDLDEKMSALQFINRLRALSHGNFNNAYFIEPNTGEKIFVKIALKKKGQ